MRDNAASPDHGLTHIDALIAAAEERLAALERERAELTERLASLRRQRAAAETSAKGVTARVPAGAESRAALVSIMRRLFRGREDVYARRWESPKTGRSGYSPACRNEWVPGVCAKPRVKCAECLQRSLLPLSDAVVRRHLFGDESRPQNPRRLGREPVIGIYPLLSDETCWFVAADFDGAAWQEDAAAFLETCRAWQVSAALERSRSGKGGHVWIPFAESVPSTLARRLGSFLLTQTMERRPEIGLRSYDRLFPNQDTMPQGGFGNLIALPLQCACWAQGNSLFVDEGLRPHEDQLAFLSSLRPTSRSSVEAIVLEAQRLGKVMGVRLPVTGEDEEEPWAVPPSRRPREPVAIGTVPPRMKTVLGN